MKNIRQLKDKIHNLSKERYIDAQILMRQYMMERFLERLSISKYKDKFILKGGLLVSLIAGIDNRSTMDIDTSITGINVTEDEVTKIIEEIITVPIEDGVSFQIKRVCTIMDEAEYVGIRVSLQALFDGSITPLKIDISTGDIITPCEISYCFHLMFEDRKIDILTYNIETLLAEKFKTIINRSITNTRIRDFYDIYIILKLYAIKIDNNILKDAILETFKNRGSSRFLTDISDVLDEIEEDDNMNKLWISYSKKFSYANDLTFKQVLDSIRYIYKLFVG